MARYNLNNSTKESIHNFFTYLPHNCILASVFGLIQLFAAVTCSAISLHPYNGGIYSISVPSGWEVVSRGECTTFNILMFDPQNPLRRVIRGGSFGPFFTNEQARMGALQMSNMTGVPMPGVNNPVLQQMSALPILSYFPLAHRYPGTHPHFPNWQILSVNWVKPIQATAGMGRAEQVDFIFEENGQQGRARFDVHMVHLGNTIKTLMFYGYTLPSQEFDQSSAILEQSVISFRMQQAYLDQCQHNQQAGFAAQQRAYKSQQESADAQFKSWQQRDRAGNRMHEKWGDAFHGEERLYDPETGQVYQFESGFYDDYNPNREQFNKNQLQPLPDDDEELWEQAPLPGWEHLE